MSWAASELGAHLVDSGDGESLDALVSIALRRNPRRAHLLVSSVLGKHVPVAPSTALSAGERLGANVEAAVGRDPIAYVLGYAETATALGHCVSARLRSRYLHSTRRFVAGIDSAAAFEEEHSHATGHRLLPDDPSLLARDGVVVLVDDEVSTGRTALNTIASMQRVRPRARYVLASLADVRNERDRAAFATLAASLGVRIDVVSLARGSVELPVGFGTAAADVARRVTEPEPAVDAVATVAVRSWPADIRDGGRHGFTAEDDDAAMFAAACSAAALAPVVDGARVLVLGCEELMYAPLLVADALQSELGSARQVLFSSTTRSPIVAMDVPGYPIRTRLAFGAHDGTDTAPRFAYNVASAAGVEPFDDIVLVVDDVADTDALRDGLLAQLSAASRRTHLLVVPSYQPVRAPVAMA